MAPHQQTRSGSLRGTLVSVFFIMVGIVACSITLVIGIDISCRVDINHWLPVYPEAELVESDYDRVFFRPRATGITSEIYYTSDDPVAVRRWYGDYRREITRNTETGDRVARGLATTNYTISDNREGAGTFIRLNSECAFN